MIIHAMVWQKNLRESLGIVAAIFLDESPGGSWRSCQDSLEFFCFIYVKSTLFSCVCQSHFRRPQGYFSCKFTRKTYFFSEQANTSSQNRNQFRFSVCRETRSTYMSRPGFRRKAKERVEIRRKESSPSTAIWPAFSDSWQQI